MVPVAEFGRYALYLPLGVGGHAEVHLGVARGRDPMPVAIKRLHEQFQHNPKAIAQLYDEVRLARQVQHPNTVRVLELVSDGADTLAVFEYVHGEPLSRLLKEARARHEPVPVSIAVAVAYDALLGLHAAHNAKSPDGSPLGLVHRDVSPSNVLVGADGVARITDFGIAKAEGRMNSTQGGGAIRGKLVYLAPEQVGGKVDRRTDVYAVGLTLWQTLTGRRPIDGPHEAAIVAKALDPQIPKASRYNREVSPALDDILAKALAKNPDERFKSASSFAAALQKAVPIAEPSEVSEWVMRLGGPALDERWEGLQAILETEQSAVSQQPGSGGTGSYPTPGAYPSTGSYPLAVLPPDTLAATHSAPIAAPVAPSEPRSKSTIIAWIATGCGLAFAVYARIHTVPEPPVARLPPPPAASAEPVYYPEPPASAAMPVPVPSSGRAPGNVGTDPFDAPPTTPPPKKPTTPPKPASTPRKPPAPKADNCNPPTFVDAKGIKRYKPSCM